MYTRKLRALLVDPYDVKITEIQYSGRLEEMREILKCGMVETVNFDEHKNTFYIDEEGMLTMDPDKTQFFVITFPDGTPSHLIAGRGLVVGPPTKGGNESNCLLPIASVTRRIRWIIDPAGAYRIGQRLMDNHGVAFTPQEHEAFSRRHLAIMAETKGISTPARAADVRPGIVS